MRSHASLWVAATDWLLELVAPSCCAACGEPSVTFFCAGCGAPGELESDRLSDVPLIALGSYEQPLKDAIGRLKYRGCPELAQGFARLLAPRLSQLGISPDDAFVPVPLHRARLVERGYDQAALLAGALARACGARFLPRLLERQRETSQQAAQGRAGRALNVVGAFQARQAYGSGRIILVDDVVTTGSTAQSCIDALIAVRARVLAVAAVARASPPAGRANG